MKFKGNSKELKQWFDMLISLYGVGAKMADIQKSVLEIRG